jgi:hypothetical protein
LSLNETTLSIAKFRCWKGIWSTIDVSGCLQEYGLIGIFIWNVTSDSLVVHCDRAKKTMDKPMYREIELKVYVQMCLVKLNAQQ